MRCRRLPHTAAGTLLPSRKRAIRLLVILSLFLGSVLSGLTAPRTDASAEASVQPSAAEIGAPVTLSVEVSGTADFRPVSPWELQPAGWEVREALCWEVPARQGQRRWHYELTLVCWQTGPRIIPPLTFGPVRTAPLRVQVLRPAGNELALNRPAHLPALRERLSGAGALTGAGLGALCGCLAAVFYTGLKRKKQADGSPEASAARLVRRLELIKEMPFEQGLGAAEEAVRLYWQDRLAEARGNATLRELSRFVPEEWRELLLQLEFCKYNPESARAIELRQWSERVLSVLERE